MISQSESHYKECPYCAERILVQAIKCRYCFSLIVEAEQRLVANAGSAAPPHLGAMAAVVPWVADDKRHYVTALLVVIGLSQVFLRGGLSLRLFSVPHQLISLAVIGCVVGAISGGRRLPHVLGVFAFTWVVLQLVSSALLHDLPSYTAVNGMALVTNWMKVAGYLIATCLVAKSFFALNPSRGLALTLAIGGIVPCLLHLLLMPPDLSVMVNDYLVHKETGMVSSTAWWSGTASSLIDAWITWSMAAILAKSTLRSSARQEIQGPTSQVDIIQNT